jgi:phenolic acid decarboxylase
MIVNDSKMIGEKFQNEFNCICGKSYKHDSNYYRHKKSCAFVEEKEKEEKEEKEEKTIAQNNGGVDTELVVTLLNKQKELMDDNKELQNIIVKELIPKIGNTNTMTNCHNNNNNTTNNNKFNMNIYLNEKCKDAISLVDFINNLKITDADFDTTRTEGIVSGLTDIFTNELRDLDVRKLPIHCSDIKRETFYIKEEDEWVKDDCKKSILSEAIGKAKGKANQFLPAWIDEHPNCWKRDSPYHNEWMNVVTIRFGNGDPKFNEKNTKKILKNIASEVLIDKEIAMLDEE